MEEKKSSGPSAMEVDEEEKKVITTDDEDSDGHAFDEELNSKIEWTILENEGEDKHK